MQTLEFIKDILLALCIAILLPVTVYWGVSIVVKNPSYSDYVTDSNYSTNAKTPEEILVFNQQSNKYREAKALFDNKMFYASIIVGLLSIVIGTFISVYSLSIGFIAGGFLNIFFSLMFSSSVPLINFIIFLSLLISLIVLLLKKK